VEWAGVAATAIGALGSYFTAKEQTKAAKQIAKVKAGKSVQLPQRVISPGMAYAGGPSMGIGPLTTQPMIIPADWQVQIGGPSGIVAGSGEATAPTTTPEAQIGGGMIAGTLGAAQGMYPTLNGVMIAPAAGLFRRTQTGSRALSRFVAYDPASGGMAHYRKQGRPLLYSGDLAACKRVKKAARIASTASGYRRSASRRKR
jgi:hypothetical protein